MTLPLDCTYWAFISYSHRDEQWATWLHQSLETYRLPRTLVGRAIADIVVPRRLLPIFRDREELAGATDLSVTLKESIARSYCLIVLCSRHSAASPWVNAEIQEFRRVHGDDRIFCCVVESDPEAAPVFPPSLLTNSKGETIEPLAVDARDGKDGKRGALLKLVAAITGVRYDELRNRDKLRRRREQVRWVLGAAGAALFLAVGYIGLSDFGFDMPGSQAVRDALDAQHIFVFRPIRGQTDWEDVVRSKWETLEKPLVRKWREGHWRYKSSVVPVKQTLLSVWDASQAATPIYRGPDSSAAGRREFQSLFTQAFEPDQLVVVNGVTYGWRCRGMEFPQAEPALWTAAALACAVRRGELTAAQKAQLLRDMDRVQGATEVFYNRATGSWNIFPNQVDKSHYSVYTGALALLALLETQSAELPWQGSISRRDELIRATCRWLLSIYRQGADPGWSSDRGRTDPPAEGLTLQLWGELLRAEAQGNMALPSYMIDDMTLALTRVPPDDVVYERSAAMLAREFTFAGQVLDRQEHIRLLLYPWAIESRIRWLRRAGAYNPIAVKETAAPARGAQANFVPQRPRAQDVVKVTRALDRLLLHQLDLAIAHTREETILASETMYALATVRGAP